MKSWHIGLIALFVAAFLVVGEFLKPGQDLTDEAFVKKITIDPKVKKAPGVMIPIDPVESENISHDFFQTLKSVEEKNVQTVFKQVEDKMSELRDPSLLLIQILQIENVKQPNENLNLVKGFAINSFFHRLEEKSDFLPAPDLEQNFAQVTKNEKHHELALESATRLKEFFGYDRNQILELIDQRRDRETILSSLFN